MKFKSLLLAAAVAAVSFSGAANAAIDGIVGGNSVNSDLVLVIYDTVKDLSYVQNLDNNNFNTILATNGSYTNTFNLDASKLNIFSGSNKANLTWSLAASSFDDADPTHTGLLVTSNSASVSVLDFAALSNVNGKFKNLSLIVNQFTAIGSPSTSLNGTGVNALAASGAAASQLSGAANLWNDHISTQVDFADSAAASAKQKFWFVGSDVDGNILTTAASTNQWTLDLTNLSSATLSNASVVAPVPLPAAAWLMFSALMGLGGIARRRNAKV